MTDRTGGRGVASPLVVFLCLLLLLGAIAGVVIWTGQIEAEPIPPAPAPSASPAPSETLTDEEAIARFKELDALRQRAFEERDADLLARAFTSDSPAAKRLRASIRTLEREKAFADEQLDVLSTVVSSRSTDEVTITQVALVDIRFEDRAGNDITKSGGLERQRIRWSLRLEGDEWLLHEGTIVAARPVET